MSLFWKEASTSILPNMVITMDTWDGQPWLGTLSGAGTMHSALLQVLRHPGGYHKPHNPRKQNTSSDGRQWHRRRERVQASDEEWSHQVPRRVVFPVRAAWSAVNVRWTENTL